KRCTVLATMFWFISSAALAVDPPPPSPSRPELDAKIVDSLRETIVTGRRIFGEGDYAGCYRLYQGALTIVEPLLVHRPDLQAVIKQKMANADRPGRPADKAYIMREAIDAVRAGLVPRALWDRLGGEPAIKTVVHEFVETVAKDPKVNV